MATLTIADLEKLAELEKAATPGPWHRELLMPFPGQTWLGIGTEARPVCIVSGVVESPEGNRNVACIITARNALPELLAIAREHLKLTSALEFIGHRGHHVTGGHPLQLSTLLPAELLDRARLAGWTWPGDTAKEEA